MRFIVDAALSPVIAEGLRRAGHNAVHLVEYGLLQASDSEVMARGLDEDRVVVSADTDFAMLLATRKESGPSLILFRHPMRSPERQTEQILASLNPAGKALDEGAIVVIEETRLRIRSLPISESSEA